MASSDYIELSVELQQLISAEEANHFSIVPKSILENTYAFYIDDSRIQEINTVQQDLTLLYDRSVSLEPIDKNVLQKTLSIYYRSGNEHIELPTGNTNFLEGLILEARKINASDIHIETYSKDARVRMRIDGHLIEKNKIDKSDYAELINQIKIKSKLNITEKRLPQDGRIEYEGFDIRVSILPTHYGENVVMRILGKDASNLNIKSLGLGDKDLSVYLENIKKPNGIILISGPTGSGKTTTLYATLKHVNVTEKKIVTVEDPIEYTLKGINQVQLREDIGLDFTTALKSFLRQDPDIIMLGEIRDAKTAQMAIRASLTGHLVLSTIHTNSSIGTISRLEDMGIPSFLIAETLNLSVAQRLLRLLCKDCCVKVNTDPNDFPSSFRDTAIELPAYHYQAKGCSSCYFTGYVGRSAIYEVLNINGDVAKHIKNGTIEKASEHIALETLPFKAFELLKKGETSLDEIYPLLIQA
ncbi:GspE/PulE family protein [Dokdonia sp.]|uniref:GspE/PulE family protein n=1 Tax=Dokdonia sp. TaxID=2024995 RepID=UPI003263E664